MLRWLVLIGAVLAIQCVASEKRLVCFYDSTSYLRAGLAKMTLRDVDIALQFCTHLVYGYAGINPTTFEVKPLNVELDMYHYIEITRLKAQHPGLKVILSVGGDRDIDEAHPMKYVNLLEGGSEAHKRFIESSIMMVRRNQFDGLDLAFQLPRNKPRKVHGTLGTYWKKFKKLFTGDFVVDPEAEQHMQQYADLAINMKTAYLRKNLSLSMTVLPNVNSTWYFDVPKLVNCFEMINLAAFDFLSPDRNPEEADFTAPLFEPPEQNRLPHNNVDFQVSYWINNHCPADKLNLGIATYGRAWKMTTDSGLSGLPVVQNTDGPAPADLQSQTPGLRSWPEICRKIGNSAKSDFRGENAPLVKVSDLEQRYGNYAYRPADDNNEHGLWVSYDDPLFMSVKVNFVNVRRLGGIAVFDLSFDDFRGLCTEKKYPIVNAIKFYLN